MVAVRPGLSTWILQPNISGEVRSDRGQHVVNSFVVMLHKSIWDKLLPCFSAPEVDGFALYQLHKSKQRAAIPAGVLPAALWRAPVLGQTWGMVTAPVSSSQGASGTD